MPDKEYDEGQAACANGTPQTANPYPASTEEWFDWNSGWLDQSEWERDHD